MLSYQHIYHAGNAADVHKHLWLIRVLAELRKSGKPLLWVDTHAGRGLYDLTAPEAQKLGEYREGYLKFRENTQRQKPLPAEVKTYFEMVDSLNRKRKGFYPGSALIAGTMLSPQDRLIACEMHKGEVDYLRKSMQKFTQAKVLKQDGYAALLESIPPAGNLGGAIIDPSYEIKSEYLHVLDTLKTALQKWPQGVFLIWYPILKAGNHLPMLEGFQALKASGMNIRIDEQLFRPPSTEGKGMAGSGMIIIGAGLKI